MKKLTIPTFFVLIFISSTAFGQIDSYGLKIGAQSAGAYSEQFEFNRAAGFGVYGFADINLSPKLFSTVDLGYT